MKLILKIARVIISMTIKIEDLHFDNILIAKNRIKIFCFMTFHTKLRSVLNLYVLG